MTNTAEPTAPESTELAILGTAPGVREAFLAMVEAVPEAGGDAYARIVAQILQAESVDELDLPWQANTLKSWIDEPIRFETVRRMPSDFADGLGFYLVAEGTELRTGTKVIVTTGAVSVVAQLVRAHVLGQLPWTAIPRVARKPTRDGYLPMHLEPVRNGRL